MYKKLTKIYRGRCTKNELKTIGDHVRRFNENL